jgi:hypothetical protein
MINDSACNDLADRFWDGIYAFPISGQKLPQPEVIENDLTNSFTLRARTTAASQELKRALGDLYRMIAVDAVIALQLQGKSNQQVLAELTAFELGDQDTPEKEDLQIRFQDQISQVQKLAVASGMSCADESLLETETPSAPGLTLFNKLKTERHPAVYGGLKSMAVAYQSCEAPGLPAITAATPDAIGIITTTMHRDHIGWYRIIYDLPALLKTDYYLENYTKPASSCFDVTRRPLIYNYGGRPAVTAALNSSLNLFQEAGGGGHVLGIDCSGFVFTALASAGLKVSPRARLKAVSVMGTSARKFMNPRASGYACLKPVLFRGDQSIEEGDILASSGHAVIVEHVGPDPFGILDIHDEADCTADKLSLANLDFTVLQSSAYKNGIGIQKAQAADFIPTEDLLAKAMADYAITACLAHVRGSTIAAHSASASFVRHSGDPTCIDREIQLNHEDCVAGCPAN